MGKIGVRGLVTICSSESVAFFSFPFLLFPPPDEKTKKLNKSGDRDVTRTKHSRDHGRTMVINRLPCQNVQVVRTVTFLQ